MNALPDDRYDALVIDVEIVDDATSRVELVLIDRALKGEVVSIRAQHLRDDPRDLLGIPVTLIVEGGEPRIEVEN